MRVVLGLILVLGLQFEIEAMKIETAVFGGGCFWCVEAIYQEVEGVIKVESGYMGGAIGNPTYREVCSGKTGHAEVIKIKYDSDKVSFIDLLEVFFKTHNPTTLNRQGADVGTQYRSVVYYYTEKQKGEVLKVIEEVNKSKVYEDAIVTEVSQASIFYMAEKYHQDYYKSNKNQPYCRAVINPKIEKFNKLFAHLKKKN